MSSTSHRRERGFTLVELSIVLVIIGLLIGAVLKGQELIESARIKSQQTQMESYRTATSIFRDRYQGLPGDFTQATTRFGANSPTGFTIANGDGDGIVEGGGNTGEGQQFWAHLQSADLVAGLAGDAFTVGEMLPTAKINGAINALSIAVNGETTNWLRLGAPTGAGATTGAGLNAGQLGELDTQFDDGDPASGDIQTTSGANCVTGGVYDFTNGTVACLGFWRLQ